MSVVAAPAVLRLVGNREYRIIMLQKITHVITIIAAVGGWIWGSYVHFYAEPKKSERIRQLASNELVDSFSSSKAHDSYFRLSKALRPWMVDEFPKFEQKILSEPDEKKRIILISEKENSLNSIIEKENLSSDIELLVSWFERPYRCWKNDICAPSIIWKDLGPDIKIVYDTFYPYLNKVRQQLPGAEVPFGFELENLYKAMNDKNKSTT